MEKEKGEREAGIKVERKVEQAQRAKDREAVYKLNVF